MMALLKVFQSHIVVRYQKFIVPVLYSARSFLYAPKLNFLRIIFQPIILSQKYLRWLTLKVTLKCTIVSIGLHNPTGGWVLSELVPALGLIDAPSIIGYHKLGSTAANYKKYPN